MKTVIVALYNYGTLGQEAWHDLGAALTYAACTAQGLDVDFIDMKALANKEELGSRLEGYDLVAFGMMSAKYALGMEVIELAKRNGSKVLVGGIHTAAAPHELIENPDIDYVFFGESEITFPKFLKNPELFGREIRGGCPQDLDLVPLIDREIFREPLEDCGGWCGCSTMATMWASKGCAYNCAFCQPVSRKHFGKKVRRRSVKHFIDELRAVKQRYNPEFITISDDTFLYRPEWIEEFIEGYKEIRLPFFASGRADGIVKYPDLVRRLGEVGWALCSIGFESGSQRILDIYKKGITIEQSYEAARIVEEAGIGIYANYIVGFPDETKEELQMTMRMRDEIKAAIDSVAFFAPYPGSELGDKCIKEGRSLLGRHQYNRYSCEDKVKGVDYEYIRRCMGGFRE